MRHQRGGASKSGQGLAAQIKTHNNQTVYEFSRLATGACSCGGPGGRPGMAPMCRTCLAADRYMRAVEFSRLIGWNMTGFASC